MNDQTEKNKEVVREFCNLALNLRKQQEGVAKYRGSSYRQHHPTAGDGRAPFIAFVEGFIKVFPSLRFDFKRFIAEEISWLSIVISPGNRANAAWP